MKDYHQMWADLGLDLKRHDAMLAALPVLYEETFLKQRNRPQAMEYFDFVVSEIHGLRVKELVEHKAKGGKVIGSFCVYVPEEIIVAGGGICVGLCGGLDLTVPDGEKVLPRNLCPLIKSAFGFKIGRMCPYFQACDFVVGETTCDGKKKTWEILDQYVPTYVMELPQKKEEADHALWLNELWGFKQRVERATSNVITEEKLAEAISLIDARRAALARLYQLRKANPVPISGLDSLLVMQISFYDDPARFAEKVNLLCDELEERVGESEGVFPESAPRILVAGSPMPIPNWKLHSIVEGNGAAIVVEESCIGTRYLTGPTEVQADSLEAQLTAIARRQLKTNCACFTPNHERIEDVLRLVEEYKVDGVIHYSLQFCQPYLVEAVKVEKALSQQGIPFLGLETDYSQEDVGQIRTRIEAFLEMIAR